MVSAQEISCSEKKKSNLFTTNNNKQKLEQKYSSISYHLAVSQEFCLKNHNYFNKKKKLENP